jgi:hypothetical protein
MNATTFLSAIPRVPEDNPDFDAAQARAEIAERVRQSLLVDDMVSKVDSLRSHVRVPAHLLHERAEPCTRRRLRSLPLGSLLSFLLINTMVVAAQTPVIPIPQQPFALPVPPFIGQPATPIPIAALPIPEHPFMAPNGRSNIHMDAYMSDTYETAGPLGHAPAVRSTLLLAECGTVTFDSAGRLVTVCIGLVRPRLLLLNPVTLATEAVFPLPPRPFSLGNIFSSFGAGGYFFLDQDDRAVIPTGNRQIWVVAEVEGLQGTGFELVRTYDLSSVVPEDQTLQSVLPDAQGLLWFTTSGGLVGTVQPDTGDHQVIALGETISQSFAVDPVAERGGVFIVSDYALYRFDAEATGAPQITWREPYDRGTRQKPGRGV